MQEQDILQCLSDQRMELQWYESEMFIERDECSFEGYDPAVTRCLPEGWTVISNSDPALEAGAQRGYRFRLSRIWSSWRSRR